MNKYLYDIINSSGNLTGEDILLRTGVSVLFGAVIFLSYRLTHTGTVYSHKFNVTLMTLTVLTTMVMSVIGNNIALSLGMVGALSIIRFRTSIKDSRDTAYIFWTIIIGICCGVGDFVVAACGSGAVFLVLLILGRVKSENRMLLIIRADRVREAAIRRVLFEYFPKAPVIKAQNTTEEKVELIYELKPKLLAMAQDQEHKNAAKEHREGQSLSDKIYALGGVNYVNLVVQSDEIT